MFTSSVTIAANVLLRTAGLNPMRGGGVFLTDTAHVFAENTLVADNYFTNAIIPDTHPDDIYTDGSSIFSLTTGFNLIETTANCTFSGTTARCVFNQDPNLDPAGLAYNGGATPTVRLMSGSPAINAGNGAVAPGTDQRGFGRIGFPDIGAYEANGVVPTVVLTSAVSRKTHGSAGNFDVSLALSGTPSVECRSGGPNGAHTIVLTFANPLTGIGSADVSAGVGAVSSSGIGGRSASIRLQPDRSRKPRICDRHFEQRDGLLRLLEPDDKCSLGLLLGDTNGDAVVNAGDATITRSHSGENTNATNFRSDHNLDGVVNAGDTTIVRGRSGQSML